MSILNWRDLKANAQLVLASLYCALCLDSTPPAINLLAWSVQPGHQVVRWACMFMCREIDKWVG